MVGLSSWYLTSRSFCWDCGRKDLLWIEFKLLSVSHECLVLLPSFSTFSQTIRDYRLFAMKWQTIQRGCHGLNVIYSHLHRRKDIAECSERSSLMSNYNTIATQHILLSLVFHHPFFSPSKSYIVEIIRYNLLRGSRVAIAKQSKDLLRHFKGSEPANNFEAFWRDRQTLIRAKSSCKQHYFNSLSMR